MQPDVLPLKGEICTQYVRCGKAGCRCQQGKPHGPYYYRVWREGSQVRKTYVKSSELEATRARCQAHRELTEMLRDVRSQRQELMRGLQSEWRKMQRLTREWHKTQRLLG